MRKWWYVVPPTRSFRKHHELSLHSNLSERSAEQVTCNGDSFTGSGPRDFMFSLAWVEAAYDWASLTNCDCQVTRARGKQKHLCLEIAGSPWKHIYWAVLGADE